MKITTLRALSALLFLAFFGTRCQKQTVEPPTEPSAELTLQGLVQKGPFVSGSEITLAEYDARLAPTGRVFFTQIQSERGEFSFERLTLNAPLVLLRAQGYYYHEERGSTSSAPLTLQSWADATKSSTLNVNVLSHLAKARIEHLMRRENKAFDAARQQAQREVLKALNMEKTDIADASTLDISKQGEDNAVLLASSVLLLAGRQEGDVTALLFGIAEDLATDGILNEANLQKALNTGVYFTDLPRVRQLLEKRYQASLPNYTAPPFEKYLRNNVGQDVKMNAETGAFGKNLLALPVYSNILTPATYSLRIGILPSGTHQVAVRLYASAGAYTIDWSRAKNWKLVPQAENGVLLVSEGTALEADLPIQLNKETTDRLLNIEVSINGQSYLSRKIGW